MDDFMSKLKKTMSWYTIPPFPKTPSPKHNFPTLYKFNQNDRLQFWKIHTTDTGIVQTDGIVGGKVKEPNIKEIEANSVRTQAEQAVAEAQKRWIDKVAADHFPHPLDTIGVEIYNHVQSQRSQNGGMKRGVTMWGETKITPRTTSGETVLEDRLKPMLAKNYDDRKRFLFPLPGDTCKLMIQPKLDGKRAICRMDTTTGKRCLESRGGKLYMGLEHITNQVSKMFSDDICLDGELFIHKLFRRSDGTFAKESCENTVELQQVEVFQKLSEYTQHTAKKLNPERVLVEYWVYDIYDLQKTNLQRFEMVKQGFKHPKNGGNVVKLVETWISDTTPERIEQVHQEFVDKGFEGIMLRQPDGKYAPGVHCTQLMKKKFTNDSEWKIIDAKESTGGLQDGAVVWLCEKDGVQVWAKQMGNVDANRKLFVDRKKHIGKLVTLLYNDLTADGIPRFPRAKCFRDSGDL